MAVLNAVGARGRNIQRQLSSEMDTDPSAVAKLINALEEVGLVERRDGAASFHNWPVQFSRELRDRVISGRITVSFRLWQRPKVKVGGRYRVAHVHIHVDALDVMPFVAVNADDVWRSGEDDREKLRRRAAHAGPVEDDTVLYRVAFHVVERAAS